MKSILREPQPWAERALLGLLGLVMLGLVALPLGRLGLEAFAPSGRLDLGPLVETLRQPAAWRAAQRSLETSLAGAAGAVLLGGVFAALVALTDVRRKLALVFCLMLPMMTPPAVTALSWATLFGPSSPLLRLAGVAPPPGSDNPIYSPAGIMALLALQAAPLAFLVLRAGLRAIPRELVEASRLSGAPPIFLMRTVVAPLLRPAVAAAFALCFVASLGNFGIPALLGIGERYFVLPTLIYVRLSAQGPAVLTEAAALSLLVVVLSVAAIAVQLAATRASALGRPARAGAPILLRLGRARPFVEIACWAALALVLALPLLSLIATSLVPTFGVALDLVTATLDNYREALLRQPATGRAFANSFALSLGAAFALAVLALPLGYLLVWRRSRLAAALSALAELPYALPGVVLGIAMILVFLRPLPVLGVSLYGTLALIFLAYLARFYALAAKPVIAGFQQLDPRLEEAARVSGAGLLFRARTVILPLVAPVAAAGALLVFLTAFNELTVSALLWSGGAETVGVIVFNLGDSGLQPLAAAVSVASVAVVLTAMAALQAMARRLPAGALPWSEPR